MVRALVKFSAAASGTPPSSWPGQVELPGRLLDQTRWNGQEGVDRLQCLASVQGLAGNQERDSGHRGPEGSTGPLQSEVVDR